MPGAEPYDAPTASPTYEPLPTFSPAIEELDGGTSQQLGGRGDQGVDEDGKEKDRDNEGKNKKDGGKNRSRSLEIMDEDELRASLDDARERIMSGTKNGVRTVYRGSRGEIHEADMVNGHKLRVHKLLPTVRR